MTTLKMISLSVLVVLDTMEIFKSTVKSKMQDVDVLMLWVEE